MSVSPPEGEKIIPANNKRQNRLDFVPECQPTSLTGIIDFDKGDGLVPAIVQDRTTRVVLMLGYMNEDALARTQSEGKVTFYSRSKKRLWTKGETSGNYLLVHDIIPDCDGDTLLILAEPAGPVCHRDTDTCFDSPNKSGALFLEYLERIVVERKESDDKESYTRSLFEKGLPLIAQKVGEEATEVVVASLSQSDSQLVDETADLLFHLLVLLKERNVSLSQVVSKLEARHSYSR